MGDPQAVVEDHLAQIVEAAFQVIHPGTGTLQTICRANVEHQETVNGADQRFVVQIAGEEVRVARLHPAVAAQIEVPAFVRGNHPHVFALRLCALTGTAGDRHFDFVRRAQALVAVLQPDREAGGILHAVAAPGRPDAGFHRAQRFPVGMSGLKPGLHQRLPDFRQLFERGAKQVNTLPAGNFAVKAIAFRDLADGDQPVGGHFTRRHPRDDGVRSVLLNIGEKAVVGVLQRQMRRFQQILVPAGSQYRSHQRLTDLAPVPLTVAADKLVEGADMVDAHQVVNLLTRVREVFADIFLHLHALLRKLELHHLLHQRATASAAGRRFGALLNGADIRCARAYRLADIPFADVMTRTDLRAFRQRRHAQRFRRAA